MLPALAAASVVAAALLLGWALRLRAALLRERRMREAESGRLREVRSRLRAETDVRHELSAALSSMSDAVVAVDPGGRVLRLNRAAGRLLSTDPEAARGKPLGEIARAASLLDLFEETLREGAVDDRELRVAVADQPLDRPRRISARTAVLHGEGSVRIGAVAVLRDVTELRRLEGVRRDFVANVSHELKTPVAAIKAAVETLLDAPGSEPAARERFLRMAARQADRLDAIIEDLLTLARLERPGDGPELDAEWLGPVLAAAVETCRPAAEEAGVEVQLDAAPGLLAVIQGNLIEQAVVNLIGNAVKYAASGGLVRVEAAAGGPGEAVVRVIDRGPGIPPEHIPRLFERFYRADASRSRAGGGTGLGLSIVRHVAEACRGRVEVTSRPGAGTTFTLTLPAPEPSDDAATPDTFPRLSA